MLQFEHPLFAVCTPYQQWEALDRPLYWCIPVPISCRLLAGHDMMVGKKMKRFLIRFCIEPRPAAKFLWMDLSLPSTRHMESLHVVQAQHLIDLLHFLQQCFYWCYCFNDLCFTFTRFCSSLGISFEIPSEIWIIHALLHLFLCLSVALLEITISVGCVIEGLEAGVNSFQLHLWKKSKKNSPFKCLCILKPAVLWIFLSNSSILW